MKKILAALSLVALMGAGCANAPAPSVQTTPEQTAPAPTDKTDVQTSINVETSEVNEDGVPVTDVFLGEPQEKYNMEAVNFAFVPNVLNVKAGDAVQLTFNKVAGTHTFDIDETNSHYQITQGSSITFIAPTKPGSYKYYCGVGNHRQMGMEGTMIVK